MITRNVGNDVYSLECKKSIMKNALIHISKLYKNGMLISVGKYNATNKHCKDFRESINMAIDNALNNSISRKEKVSLRELKKYF